MRAWGWVGVGGVEVGGRSRLRAPPRPPRPEVHALHAGGGAQRCRVDARAALTSAMRSDIWPLMYFCATIGGCTFAFLVLYNRGLSISSLQS